MGKFNYYRSDMEIKADKAIQEAKSLIRYSKYEDAKAMIEDAINLFPRVKNGREFITLCEILPLSQKHRYNRTGNHRTENWPYTLFQIPASSTESQVKSRYETLRAHLDTIRYHQIVGTADAIKEIDLTMSMYNNSRKRKADDDDKPIREEKPAADDGSDGGGGGGADDDPYAARSPEFKKLCKHIFTALPQKPHFSPLAKYCPSVRQEIKLGFDMIFIKLTQKLQKLGHLSQEDEDTIKEELSNLEEMGYDVMKLKERFDLLVRVKTIAKEDERYEETTKNLDAQIRDEMVQLENYKLQLENVKCRISKLKYEKLMVEAKHHGFEPEMAILKSKLSKGDLCNMAQMEEVGDNC